MIADDSALQWWCARTNADSKLLVPRMPACQPSAWRAMVLLVCLAVHGVHALADSEFAVVHSADFIRNTSGGIKTGSAHLQNLDITYQTDFAGSDNTFFAYLLWNNAALFSERYSGDAQGVSNIDAEQALRLYELWYQHALSDDLSLRIGLYDLNSEFDAIDTAALFLGSSHGIGADYAQTGQLGPSIFPVTSLAARLQWSISERSTLRYAIFDGVPGDPDDTDATTIKFDDGDGALHALEYNYQFAGGSRLAVGGFLYTANFDSISELDANGAPQREHDNRGVYGFIDMPLGERSNAYVRYGVANDELNAVRDYFGAGIVFNGLLAGRPLDQLGLALASARTGNAYRAASGGAQRHETALELTYSAQLLDWLRIQPDIQYVINPGFNPALDAAVVVGLRVEIALGWTF